MLLWVVWAVGYGWYGSTGLPGTSFPLRQESSGRNQPPEEPRTRRSSSSAVEHSMTASSALASRWESGGVPNRSANRSPASVVDHHRPQHIDGGGTGRGARSPQQLLHRQVGVDRRPKGHEPILLALELRQDEDAAGPSQGDHTLPPAAGAFGSSTVCPRWARRVESWGSSRIGSFPPGSSSRSSSRPRTSPAR